MSPGRETPFALVFGALAAERFPAIEQAVSAQGLAPDDRDGFLLLRDVVQLMRELRPDDGLGAGVGALAGLLHAAFLFWRAGERVVPLAEPEVDRLLAAPPPAREPVLWRSAGAYIQLPSLRVWGTPIPDAPPEPLDGWFAGGGESLSVVAIFGLHPGRGGLTVAEAAGPPPGELRRPDGSPLFAATLPGGLAAGLASIQGEEELLELAWRVEHSL
jgi:hypothetical protein